MKPTRLLLYCACLIGVCACAPSFVLAQAQPEYCDEVSRIVDAGTTSPRLDWALAVIQNCPNGGHSLAQALTASRASRDTAYLNALTHPAIRLRDGELFAAALAVAGDRSASLEARVFAIRTLMWSMYPGGGIAFDDLADRVPTGRTRNCFGFGPSTHTQITQGARLPGDYVTRAKAMANRINNDSTEALPVRRAAACLSLLQPWGGLPQ